MSIALRKRASQARGAMGEEQTAVLEVRHLTMWRDGAVPIDDVSWRVSRGEHWAILGPNGSGKTSLLAAITRYAPASRGDLELLGHRFGKYEWRVLRKRIGVVSSAIQTHLGERDQALRIVASGKYAAFGPWFTPLEDDLRRARELLSEVRSEHVASRPWSVLSQGERQRVLIARALMADPDLLLLDEPCAGLDPVARERLLQVLEGLADRVRPTLVLVTHHIEEVVPSISHVLLLSHGRVAASGPKERVLTGETLAHAFEHPLEVGRRGDRFTLRIDVTPDRD